MVGRPSRRRRCHPGKPQGRKVQLVDTDLDRPNRVLLADVILHAVWKQRLLHPIFPIDEPINLQAPEVPKPRDSKTASPKTESTKASISRSFHTASTHSHCWRPPVRFKPSSAAEIRALYSAYPPFLFLGPQVPARPTVQRLQMASIPLSGSWDWACKMLGDERCVLGA